MASVRSDRHARLTGSGLEARHVVALPCRRPRCDRGDPLRASAAADEVLQHLAAGGTLQGTESSPMIQWRCHAVLAHAGDPRATVMLDVAHAELQARARKIGDRRLRASFLASIPEHRAIVSAWAAAHPG